MKAGALLEQFDIITGTYQPIGHIAPPFFRVFDHIDYPDESDIKLTRKLKFGLPYTRYNYNDCTVGLELEYAIYNDRYKLSEAPSLEEQSFIHPTTEFFHQISEVGTNPNKGGVYSDLKTGYKVHKKVNQYLANLNFKNKINACISGVVPIGNISGKDVSTENEYLRRISIWLSKRRNKKCTGINDSNLKCLIKEYEKKYDFNLESNLHKYTALYDVLTFQPMFYIPNLNGDFCIEAINFLNGPINLSLIATSANSPFWKNKYTGFKYYRGQLRNIFETGLYLPKISLWNLGTRDRVIKHLKSGEGINLGRAILSDDKLCYSNSTFRIRPDIGGIEIAGLDSHPSHTYRVAVSEVYKLLIYILNNHLINGLNIYEQPFSGTISKRDYYRSYSSISQQGIHGYIYNKRTKYTIKEILILIFDFCEDFLKKDPVISPEHFAAIKNNIISQFNYKPADLKVMTFEKYFKLATKNIAPNLADLFVERYKNNSDVTDTIKEYIKAFNHFYISENEKS